jgi:hypothetical protein
MKTDNTPSEIINYIAELLRERQNKSLPTYYTISIEQYNKLTPVAEREEGHENFKKEIFKYISDYNLTSILIQLYTGKSRKSKTPIQEFKIPVKKQDLLILNGLAEKSSPEIAQSENSVPVHRYYDEKFELQMKIMRTEMEKQAFLDKIAQLTDRYEDRIKDNDIRHKERISQLENDIRDLESEVKEFEREIHRYERDKHNAFGNIALGNIGARIAENFARSDMGSGILKGFTQLQGHIQGSENPTAPIQKSETNARIIETGSGETNNPRQTNLQLILKASESLDENNQKMLCDILDYHTRDTRLLKAFWEQLESLKNQNKSTT